MEIMHISPLNAPTPALAATIRRLQKPANGVNLELGLGLRSRLRLGIKLVNF